MLKKQKVKRIFPIRLPWFVTRSVVGVVAGSFVIFVVGSSTIKMKLLIEHFENRTRLSINLYQIKYSLKNNYFTYFPFTTTSSIRCFVPLAILVTKAVNIHITAICHIAYMIARITYPFIYYWNRYFEICLISFACI